MEEHPDAQAADRQGDGPEAADPQAYELSEQAGFNLRRANQRHVAIFARRVQGLTPTQFAALARLHARGPLSQNLLGRLTAMDSATIKGVVERLKAKRLAVVKPDPDDGRRRIVELTPEGAAAFERALPQALASREETLAPLSAAEIRRFEALLLRLV
ncbi:MAG: MarR family transcriptional regulator [Pseudomonadota bacterium]